ncbi:MAG: hypothetical protein V1722_03535 [Candidatus Micrarchaeota archaeon]
MQSESLALTPNDRRRISAMKSRATELGRSLWLLQDAGRYADQSSLSGVNRHLERDFVHVVRDLSVRFPRKTINVLFEGCGASSFPEELTKKCRTAGLKVRVFRTDLYSRKRFQQLVAFRRQTVRNYNQAAPEELAETFGENKFHLVVSRSGGLNYTPLPPIKGIHALCKTLKPGGEAHIITEDVDQPSLPEGKAIWLNQHGKQTPVGAYFEGNPKYSVVEEKHVTGAPYLRFHPILRITKRQ